MHPTSPQPADRPDETSWALVGVRVWDGVGPGTAGDAISFGAGGRVTAVGSRATVLSGLPSGSEIVEGAGETVVPGFVDAHTHVRAAATARLSASCGGIGSPEELLSLVAAEAARTPSGSWVTLVGLDPHRLASPLPLRSALDAASPLHPVRIRHRSLHAWLLNGRAVELLRGVLGEEPPDALVIDDRGDLRRAFGRVCDPLVQEEAVRSWSSERLGQGVVAVLDATVTNGLSELDQLRDWACRGVILQDVGALAGEDTLGGEHDAGAVGVKLMFAGEPRDGDRARERLLVAWERLPLAAVHCADPDALGDLLTALEAIPPRRRGRLRIEHASLTPPEWLPRLAAVTDAVVTQPAFVAAHGDRYLATIDPPLHDWLYRLRSWLDVGVELAAGSDEPAGPADPLVAWRASIARTTATGTPLGPAEALTRRQALTMLSTAAARVSGFAGLGRLRAGDRGSAVLLAGDPLGTGDPDGVRVAGVILDGVRQAGGA